jgi:hypothetical protein
VEIVERNTSKAGTRGTAILGHRGENGRPPRTAGKPILRYAAAKHRPRASHLPRRSASCALGHPVSGKATTEPPPKPPIRRQAFQNTSPTSVQQSDCNSKLYRC